MISSGLISVVLLFFLTRFLFKINRNNTTKSISNSYMSSSQNIEIKRNAIETESSIESVEHPVKMKNCFLNPNDDFGTLKKGVVLDNQTYEYEVNENDSSNFTILELGDESKEITE
jgi:hypothetical protein